MKKRELKFLKSFRFKRFDRKSYSAFNSIGKTILIGVLCGTTLSVAQASNSSSMQVESDKVRTDSIATYELDELVVTGSGVAQAVLELPKMVTVLSKAEISRVPIQSIHDIYSHLMGIDLHTRGGHGVQADMSLRGGSAEQVAILLNGVNLSNPQTGHYNLDVPINLSDIERIEIIRGTSAITFGAGALSGAINIITKRKQDSKIKLKAETGMHGLYGAEFKGSYSNSNSYHSLSVGHNQSKGYIPQSDYKITNMFLSSVMYTKKATIDLQMGGNLKAYGANTFYSPNYPDQFDDTKSLFASIKAETKGTVIFRPLLYWSRHYDTFHLFREGTANIPDWYKSPNRHISDVIGGSILAQYKRNNSTTNLVIDARNEIILSNKLGIEMPTPDGYYTNKASRLNMNYSLEHNIRLDRLSLSGGVTASHSSAFGNKLDIYPAINMAYNILPELRVFALWNWAERLPTFTDLYYTQSDHEPDPNLKKEKSEAYEIGAKFNNYIFKAEASLFFIKAKDVISWNRVKDGKIKWASSNIPFVNRTGVEVYCSANMKKILGNSQPLSSVSLGYMYLTQNKKEERESVLKLNHLKNNFISQFHFEILKSLSANICFRFQERTGMYNPVVDGKVTKNQNYKPYALVDLKINYDLTDSFNIYINANNLLNTRYFTVGDIPQPGLWITGGVCYTLR